MPIYKQTLNSTSQLASHVMKNLDICGQAYFRIKMAESYNTITLNEKAEASELGAIASANIHEHLDTMASLAENVVSLTEQLQRNCSTEIMLLNNMIDSLYQFQELYGDLRAKNANDTRQEMLQYLKITTFKKPPIVQNVNVLSLGMKMSIANTIEEIDEVIKNLNSKNLEINN